MTEEKEIVIEEKKEGKKGDKKDELLSTKNILIAALIFFVLSETIAFFFYGTTGLVLVNLAALDLAAAYYSMYVFFAPREIIMGGITEATGKLIAVGTKKNKSIIRAVISYKGHELNDEGYVVPVGENHKKSERSGFIKFMETLFPGLIFIGVPGIHWIWKYEFRWTSAEQNGELKTRTKILNYIYLKRDIYVATLTGAEVGITFVPVNIQINITAAPVSPYKALIDVENWLEYIVNTIKVLLRDFVGQIGQDLTEEEQKILDGIIDLQARNRVEIDFHLKKAHAVFVAGKNDLGNEIFKKLEASGDLKEFKEKIGVLVFKVQIPNIDYGTLQELALAQYRALQEGEAKIISETKTGEAYKARRTEEATADVNYIQKTFSAILAFGDEGVLLRTLEALKATDKVITLGSIQNITDQFLGLKPDSSIKPDTIANLLKKTTGKELSEISKEDIENILNALKVKEATK